MRDRVVATVKRMSARGAPNGVERAVVERGSKVVVGTGSIVRPFEIRTSAGATFATIRVCSSDDEQVEVSIVGPFAAVPLDAPREEP